MHGIGEAIDAMFAAMFGLIVIFVPLGLWKLIEIIIWVFSNVSVSVGASS